MMKAVVGGGAAAWVLDASSSHDRGAAAFRSKQRRCGSEQEVVFVPKHHSPELPLEGRTLVHVDEGDGLGAARSDVLAHAC
jgi:hypothetical protein